MAAEESACIDIGNQWKNQKNLRKTRDKTQEAFTRRKWKKWSYNVLSGQQEKCNSKQMEEINDLQQEKWQKQYSLKRNNSNRKWFNYYIVGGNGSASSLTSSLEGHEQLQARRTMERGNNNRKKNSFGGITLFLISCRKVGLLPWYHDKIYGKPHWIGCMYWSQYIYIGTYIHKSP